MDRVTELLFETDNEIIIWSGEGEILNRESYKGKRTRYAINRRLNKERENGDRIAIAKIFSHSNEYGDVFVNVETGEYC